MFITVLGQHVSILIESSSGPSKNTDPHLAIFKTRCGIPNTYILDITMYKMHVSLFSYYTVRILIYKTLTGTYEAGYTYVFEMCCYRTLGIVIYIVANYTFKLSLFLITLFVASHPYLFHDDDRDDRDFHHNYHPCHHRQ